MSLSIKNNVYWHKWLKSGFNKENGHLVDQPDPLRMSSVETLQAGRFDHKRDIDQNQPIYDEISPEKPSTVCRRIQVF